MSKYEGLYTFDIDNHRYIPVGQADRVIDCFTFREEESKPPLIKDEKIRKAVRAWAEALDADEIRYNSCAEYSEGRFEAEMGMADIDFGRVLWLKDGTYTIAELCGEDEE